MITLINRLYIVNYNINYKLHHRIHEKKNHKKKYIFLLKSTLLYFLNQI